MTTALRATAMAGLLVAVALLPAATGGAVAQEDQVTLTLEVVTSGGQPVGGAELDVSWDGGAETVTTRANGQALVDVPRGSNVTVTVSHDTYMRNFPSQLTNASGGTVTIPVSLSGTVEVTVEGSAGPITDATVRLVKRGKIAASVTTGNDGTAVAGPVERGEYGFVVRKPGYYTNASTIHVGAKETRTVQIRPGVVDIGFNVTDGHFDPPEPVANATVELVETGDTLRTLGSGQRVTTAPVNRRYTVRVFKDGYQSVERTVRVHEQSKVVDVNISRTAELNVQVANDRVVVGESTRLTATNAYGEPMEGAEVRIRGTVVGTTAADGTIQLPIDRAGNNTFEIRKDGLTNETTVEGIEPATPTPTPTATPTPSPTPTSGGGPGFTAPIALLALLALVTIAVAVRRRGD